MAMECAAFPLLKNSPPNDLPESMTRDAALRLRSISDTAKTLKYSCLDIKRRAKMFHAFTESSLYKKEN